MTPPLWYSQSHFLSVGNHRNFIYMTQIIQSQVSHAENNRDSLAREPSEHITRIISASSSEISPTMPFLQLLSVQSQTGRLLTCVEAQEEHVLPHKPLHCFFLFKCHCPARIGKCSAPRFASLQWQSLIQNLQAEEEHPRGLTPVRAAETCRGNAGQWEPEAGCHAARGRGSQWVDCCQQWVNECNAPIYRNHRSVLPQLPFEVSKREWALCRGGKILHHWARMPVPASY